MVSSKAGKVRGPGKASCKWVTMDALRGTACSTDLSHDSQLSPPPGTQRSPDSRQHQGVLGEAAGPGVLLVVEHGQSPEDGGQALPGNQHCRQSWGGELEAASATPTTGAKPWAGAGAGPGAG